MPENRTHDNTVGSALVREFPWAASSAILLSLTRDEPGLWFVSLFALVPYLWRLYRVSTRDSVVLGIILATSFIFATGTSELWLRPRTFLLKLFALNISLAILGLAISKARKRFGFNPLLIALLWFPTEYLLIRYAGLPSIFSITSDSPSLLVGFCSLFGVLLGSLVIVLGNSLLLLILRYVERRIFYHKGSLTESDNERYYVFDEVIFDKRWYCFPDVRAPPQSGPSLQVRA